MAFAAFLPAPMAEITVTGSATVISAMGAGRKAAKAMHEYLIRDKRQ